MLKPIILPPHEHIYFASRLIQFKILEQKVLDFGIPFLLQLNQYLLVETYQSSKRIVQQIQESDNEEASFSSCFHLSLKVTKLDTLITQFYCILHN